MSMDLDRCWFIDVDGTIFEHQGDYTLMDALFNKNWNLDNILPGVKHFWDHIPESDHIVITTARPAIFKFMTERALRRHGLRYDYILMDLPAGKRVLINDTKPTDKGGYNTAHAVSVERNTGLDWNDIEKSVNNEGTDTV